MGVADFKVFGRGLRTPLDQDEILDAVRALTRPGGKAEALPRTKVELGRGDEQVKAVVPFSQRGPGHPAMADPASGLKQAVFTRWRNSETIRTDRYHYTEWRNDAGRLTARMLYDHREDPGERRNVAEDPAYSLVLIELARTLEDHVQKRN